MRKVTDKYVGKYIILICECTGTTVKYSIGLEKVINKIYEDGFEDGYNKACEEDDARNDIYDGFGSLEDSL